MKYQKRSVGTFDENITTCRMVGYYFLEKAGRGRNYLVAKPLFGLLINYYLHLSN